jgi:hypothetical protein
MNTIVMKDFNSIPFQKLVPADKQHIYQSTLTDSEEVAVKIVDTFEQFST